MYRAVIKDHPTIRKRYEDKGEITIVDPAKYPTIISDIEVCCFMMLKTCYLQYFSEPLSSVTIIAPMKYTSEVMVLCKSRRGEQRNAEAIDGERILFKYDMP